MAPQPDERLFIMGAWERRRGVEKLAPPVLRCFTWPDEVFFHRAKNRRVDFLSAATSSFPSQDYVFCLSAMMYFPPLSTLSPFQPRHFRSPVPAKGSARVFVVSLGGERHSQKQQHPNAKSILPSLPPDCTSPTFTNDALAIELFSATTYPRNV